MAREYLGLSPVAPLRKISGQELNGPEGGYSVGRESTYALTGSFRLEWTGTAKLLPGRWGTQNAITFNIKT